MKEKVMDYDYSLTEVGQESKKGLFSMFVIMLGFTFFSASLRYSSCHAQAVQGKSKYYRGIRPVSTRNIFCKARI